MAGYSEVPTMTNNPRTLAHIPLDRGRYISKEFYDNPLVRVYFYRTDSQPLIRSKLNWAKITGANKIITVNVEEAPWDMVDIVKFDTHANLMMATLHHPELGTPDSKDMAWDHLSVDIEQLILEDIKCYTDLLKHTKNQLKMWRNNPERVLHNLDQELTKDPRGNRRLRYMLKNLKSTKKRRSNFGPMSANSILGQIRQRQTKLSNTISRISPRKRLKIKI